MRIVLLFIIALIVSCSKTSNYTHFRINCEVESMNGAKLRLTKYGKVLDSAVVYDGSYTLQAMLPNLELCTVFVSGRFAGTKTIRGEKVTAWAGSKSFFVEKGTTYKWFVKGNNLTYKEDSVITSSVQHRYFERLDSLKKAHFLDRKKKMEEFELASEYYLEKADMNLYQAYSDSITSLSTSIGKLNQIRNKFFLAHPNTYATIHGLSESHSLTKDFEVYNIVYEKLSPEFKSHKYAKIYKERADHIRKLRSGGKIKLDIVGEDGNQVPFDLGNYKRYKMIYLDIWASWCTPCRDMMPAARSVQYKLFDEGIMYAFISIDQGGTRKAWAKLNTDLDLYHSYLLDDATSKEFQSVLGIESIPRYVIIDNNGNLLEKDAPGPDQPEKLHALFAKLRSKYRL